MKFSLCWLDRVKKLPPRGYGFAYDEFASAREVYYPLPINYIVRYWRNCYWGFLRFFYRIGLIDTNERECFRWADFFRIKVH